MHALLFFASSGLCGVSSSKLPASARTGINGREIADGALHVASQRSLLQPSCSSSASEGNRRGRPQRNVSNDENSSKLKILPTSDNETPRPSNQDEIIALFRRIQLSISRGSTVSRTRSRKSSREKQSAESVLRTLQQYPRKKHANEQSQEEVGGSPQERDALDDGAARDFRASRPQSNFVKKSPISPPPLKENAEKVVEEQVSEIGKDVTFESQKLEGMKLAELKELAKTRGVKGYSKLKKGVLIELLKRVFKSSIS